MIGGGDYFSLFPNNRGSTAAAGSLIYLTEDNGSQDGAINGDDAFVVVLLFGLLLVDQRVQGLGDDSSARMAHIFVCN